MAQKASARATLADVAALSGMSTAAVSLVLNDRPGTRISAEAMARIRAAADELNYEPNPAARILRTGRTRTIGFVSDEVTITRYASRMIVGALAAAKQHEHAVMMAETEGDPRALREAVNSMLKWRVDGIAVALMAARLVELPTITTRTPSSSSTGAPPTTTPASCPTSPLQGTRLPKPSSMPATGESASSASNPRTR